jgi:hypothetical protein
MYDNAETLPEGNEQRDRTQSGDRGPQRPPTRNGRVGFVRLAMCPSGIHAVDSQVEKKWLEEFEEGKSS